MDEKKRLNTIRNLAAREYSDLGRIEIDNNADVSEGDDNGAFVQAWVWVDFAGVPGLDKASEATCLPSSIEKS